MHKQTKRKANQQYSEHARVASHHSETAVKVKQRNKQNQINQNK